MVNIEDNTGTSPTDTLQSLMLRHSRSSGSNLEEYQKFQSLLEYLWNSSGEY